MLQARYAEVVLHIRNSAERFPHGNLGRSDVTMNAMITKRVEDIYRVFGCNNEQPLRIVIPSGKNALMLDDEKSIQVISREIELLERIAGNPAVGQLARDCDTLLEEIANCSSLEESISEVDAHFDDLAIDFDRTFLGLTLYDQLASIDHKTSVGKTPRSRFRRSIASGTVSPTWAVGVSQVSSLILRLYLVLTFFRGDVVTNVLRSLTLESNSYLDLYRQLFTHEYVRHARNAFAHGHIRQVLAGVYIEDRSFSTLITPGMMEKLSIWIWMFYYDLFIVHTKRQTGAA